MKKRTTRKRFGLLVLLALMLLIPWTSIYAFEGRGGDTVLIEADEVVDDDLYVAANNFVLNGTVTGDLIVAGATIKINGTVEGDLMATGQTVIIDGTVRDDARIVGYVLKIGSNAQVGDDLLGASSSLETEAGSSIDGDVVFSSLQAFLAGAVGEDVIFRGNGLELRGRVGGNVEASVGSAGDIPPFDPFAFVPGAPPVPSVDGGLTLASGAQIEGDLHYSSTTPSTIPDERVSGEVGFKRSESDQEVTRQGRGFLPWLLQNLRRLVALIVVGLPLLWLAPRLLNGLAHQMKSKPLPGLGWGVVTFFGFPIAIFILIGVILVLAIILYVLTLGNLVGAIIWLGIALIITLIVLFVLVISFLPKIVVGNVVGNLILNWINPGLTERQVWPLVLGILVVVILIAIPFVGGILNFVITLFGLGTLGLLWRTGTGGEAEQPITVEA